MYVVNMKKTLFVPGEPEMSVVIRKLSAKRLRKCREARQVSAVDLVKRLGGAATIKELQGLGDGTNTEAERAAEAILAEAKATNPALGYDQDALLVEGIVSWTYEGDPAIDPADQVEEATAGWLATQIAAYAEGKEIQEKNV